MPLWSPAIPPLIDLPAHMGRYHIALHGADAPMLARSFSFQWQLIGNLAVDLLVMPLGSLLGVELATKYLVIATVFVSAVGLIWLAREVHGHVPPTVLFVLPLIYNWPFHYGFINYSLTIGVALVALALWVRLGRLGRLRLRFWLFIPIGLLIWIGHSAAWGAFGLAAFGTDLARRHGAGQSFWRAGFGAGLACLPLALPALLFPVAPTAKGTVFLPSLVHKLPFAYSLLRDRYKYLDAASGAALLALGAAALASRRLAMSPLLFWPGLLIGVAALAMPYEVRGSAFADMRLFPVAAMLMLLAIAPRDIVTGRWLAALGLAFLITRIAANTFSFHQFDVAHRAELQAIEAIPKDSSVLVLVVWNCGTPWTSRRDENLGSLAIVRRDAFTNDQFAATGAQLLTVTRPDAGPLRVNPSQLVMPDTCPNPIRTDFDTAITTFNRQAFDHVWTIGAPRHRVTARDLVPIWSNHRSTLYRVVRPPRSDLPK
jgi:hypothetical protein